MSDSEFTDPAFVGLSARIGLGEREQASVRLLKAEYLVWLWRSGKRLQRRQDIAEENFFDEPLDQPGTRIVVVSYRWHTKAHPDPDGFSLSILGPVLHTYLQCVLKVAVFLGAKRRPSFAPVETARVTADYASPVRPQITAASSSHRGPSPRRLSSGRGSSQSTSSTLTS